MIEAPKIPLRVIYSDDGIEELQYWANDEWHFIPQVKVDSDFLFEID